MNFSFETACLHKAQCRPQKWYQAEQEYIYHTMGQGDQWKASGLLEYIAHNKSC